MTQLGLEDIFAPQNLAVDHLRVGHGHPEVASANRSGLA